MPDDPFLDEDSRVLTPEAFEFVLNNELKRAVRSQNFLTLLVLDPAPEPPRQERDSRVLQEVAKIVSREVRETDLLSQNVPGQLSVVLLDADMNRSMVVVDRLAARFRHYQFPTPVVVEIGAACCPTDGADAQTLRRAAEAHPVRPLREDRGNASNAH